MFSPSVFCINNESSFISGSSVSRIIVVASTSISFSALSLPITLNVPLFKAVLAITAEKVPCASLTGVIVTDSVMSVSSIVNLSGKAPLSASE